VCGAAVKESVALRASYVGQVLMGHLVAVEVVILFEVARVTALRGSEVRTPTRRSFPRNSMIDRPVCDLLGGRRRVPNDALRKLIEKRAGTESGKWLQRS